MTPDQETAIAMMVDGPQPPAATWDYLPVGATAWPMKAPGERTSDRLDRVAETIAGPHSSRLDRSLPEQGNGGRGEGSKSSAGGDPVPPEFTEDSLALRFTEAHAHDLRYVSAWGWWFAWLGTHWRREQTLRVFDDARKICRTAAEICGKPAIAVNIRKARTVSAVEMLARSDRRHAATTDQWDANDFVLNTPAGTIDLKSGETRPHRAADYCTKITAVSPGGDCPRWKDFLAEVTNRDTDLMDYLQRVLGYALTGNTGEHALFFLYGTGANGKSVLLSTVSGILGNYHRAASIETFTARKGDTHPTDVAGLNGARLVTAGETEEGRRWAEAKIKSLTGGDPITARFMRQDFFDYKPSFKLIIGGNHRPGLRSVDEAIRRRLHLIPFAVTIPPDRRDKALVDKLRAEWPGILQWMVEGCLKWQDVGLKPPEAVSGATKNYLDAEDSLSSWIEDRCEVGARFWEGSGRLFESWRSWAELAGEPAGSQKLFAQKLESRGFVRAVRGHGNRRGFEGLRVVSLEPPSPYSGGGHPD